MFRKSALTAQQAAELRQQLEQIFRDTHAAMHSYVGCLGVPSAQVQEITQEVYLRLYQTMRDGQQILNSRAWLFRVAHNLSDKVRSREKPFYSVSEEWDRYADSASESPEQALLQRERTRKLQAALQTLSPQQRHCLFLRAQGLRYREIADVMHISSSSVNEFLRRAMARLAEAAGE